MSDSKLINSDSIQTFFTLIYGAVVSYSITSYNKWVYISTIFLGISFLIGILNYAISILNDKGSEMRNISENLFMNISDKIVFGLSLGVRKVGSLIHLTASILFLFFGINAMHKESKDFEFSYKNDKAEFSCKNMQCSGIEFEYENKKYKVLIEEMIPRKQNSSTSSESKKKTRGSK